MKTTSLIAAIRAGEADLSIFETMAVAVETALSTMEGTLFATMRDGDDLLYFDTDHVRIGLEWIECDGSNYVLCAVGPHSETGRVLLDSQHIGALARALVESAVEVIGNDSVMWHSSPKLLTPDLMDEIAETLYQSVKAIDQTPDMVVRAALEGPVSPRRPTPRTRQRQPKPEALNIAKPAPAEMPDPATLSREEKEMLRELRGIITAPDEVAPPSSALRMSTFFWSYTFLLINPPVGATLLTYAALRETADLLPHVDLTAFLPRMAGGQMAATA